uniref:Uncharacterized protein n=1 Tax=Panagrolaimus sp. ES5 TaxID=591445 RepID=A0AC34GQH2_9BILA
MFQRGNGNSSSNFDKKDNSTNVKNSTLSLHIVAYENSDEVSSECNEEECSKKKNEKMALIKKWKNTKQIFNDSASFFQNPFEFPRQHKNQNIKPEIMQFKASQRLLNPNESKYDDESSTHPEELTTEQSQEESSFKKEKTHQPKTKVFSFESLNN